MKKKRKTKKKGSKRRYMIRTMSGCGARGAERLLAPGSSRDMAGWPGLQRKAPPDIEKKRAGNTREHRQKKRKTVTEKALESTPIPYRGGHGASGAERLLAPGSRDIAGFAFDLAFVAGNQGVVVAHAAAAGAQLGVGVLEERGGRAALPCGEFSCVVEGAKKMVSINRSVIYERLGWGCG